MLYNHIERQEKMREKIKDQDFHDVAKAPGLK